MKKKVKFVCIMICLLFMTTFSSGAVNKMANINPYLSHLTENTEMEKFMLTTESNLEKRSIINPVESPKIRTAQDILLYEDFESGMIPTDWQVIVTEDTNNNPYGLPTFWGIFDSSIKTAHSGTYQAGLWWSRSHQDEWLITPEIDLTNCYYPELKFWTYSYSNLSLTYESYNYIKISTDSGETWTVLDDLVEHTPEGWNEYATPICIDLSPYASETVRVAWHAFSPLETEHGLCCLWMIDDVEIVCHRLGEWEKLNGPYGCYLADLAIDPTNPQIVYAAVDGGGGVYKSTDGGQTWSVINEGLTNFYGWDIEMDPSKPNTLYLGTWGKFFKSNNGGDSWSEITYNNVKFSVVSIAINPIDPEILYAGGYNSDGGAGIYKTTDGGETWTIKDNGIINPRIWSIAIDPNNPSIIYVGTWLRSDNYIYKSVDAGESWNVVFTTNVAVNCISIDPINTQTVYAATDSGLLKSNDAGETWTESGYGITNPFVRHITTDPTNSNILYSTSWGGVFKSVDGGGNWNMISQDFNTQFAKPVIIDPSNNQNVYVGVWGGVYKSSDAAESWIFNNDGLRQDVAIMENGLILHPYDNQIMYACTFGGGVYKTTTGGEDWYTCNCGLIQPAGNGGGGCCYVEPDILFLGTDGSGIYRTFNGGESWEACNNGLSTFFIYNIVFDPFDYSTLYIGTTDGPYISTDFGDNWILANEGIEGQVVRKIFIDPQNPLIIYATADNLVKSIDGGLTWNECFLKEDGWVSCIAIDDINPQVLYAGTWSGGIFKSSDAGGTWIEKSEGIDANIIRELVINPENPQIIYTSTSNGIFKTTNSGDIWIPWNENLPFADIKDIILDPQDPSIVYAGTGGGVFKGRAEHIPPMVEMIKPNEEYLYIFDREIMPFLFPVIIGPITIEVEAIDEYSGINRLEFYVDNELKHTDDGTLYDWLWDETIFFKHTLKVIAYDNAGNSAADERDVWIFNWG